MTGKTKASAGKEKRRFLRYPIKVPMKLRLDQEDTPIQSQTGDLSKGGLHFYWMQELETGTLIRVTIPVLSRLFKLNGKVTYSLKDHITGLFRTGISFEGPVNSFRAKLAEEILRIKKYRTQVSKKTGHFVSEEEAAQKWIREYSKDFSEIYK